MTFFLVEFIVTILWQFSNLFWKDFVAFGVVIIQYSIVLLNQ
jgi:hypothetical protein